MKTFNYSTLIILATLTVACNEKISPKMLDANQSTTVPPVIEPEEYYFRVVNTSPAIRKFHLHKSGVGNYDTPCEIKSTNKFSSSLFRDPQRKHEFDISCIFEAEELAMAEKGFSFKFESSPNTCEYVGYSPFSFYSFKPGDSSAAYTSVICEQGVNTGDLDDSSDSGLRPSSFSGPIGCNQMVIVDDDILPQDRVAFSIPKDDMDLCRYNYSQDDGPDCDRGIITITDITYSSIPAEDENDPPIIKGIEGRTRTVRCGGKISACIDGPITQEPLSNGKTALVTKYETVKNQSFAEEKTYAKPPESFGPMFYSNFRRNLASPDINYVTQTPPGVLGYGDYIKAFDGYTNFTPLVMENYAAGLSYGGLNSIFTLSWEDNVTIGGRVARKGISYAAEPFMGQGDYRTSPFYTFYCLDSASEIRARIKMVVRDWDRHFSPNRALFDIISDIDKGPNARMDNPTGVEYPGDGDSLNDLNDFTDWDDFLLMSRTPGVIDPVTTVWEPINGFHNKDNFPQVTKDTKVDQE